MLNQLEALVEATTIVSQARMETAGKSSELWKQLNRIYEYLDAQVLQMLNELKG